MISLDQALAAYASCDALPARTLPLSRALGLSLAADVHSPVDLPLGTQSAMDGYAVIAADLTAASPETPTALHLVETIHTGTAPRTTLRSGEAMRIFTGAWLPDGADAVIQQERVHRTEATVSVLAAIRAGHNVRHRGETLRAGQLLCAAGTRVSPGVLGLLAQCGVAELSCTPKPKIAIITTGSELKPPGSSLLPGQAYECNSSIVAGFVQQWGCELVSMAAVEDDLDASTEAISRAAELADIVVTTGGASVGDRDFVPRAALAAGFKQVFWKVAQKPGKPLLYARRGQTALLALPGNPASVFVCAALHLQRLSASMAGQHAQPNWKSGVLAEPVSRDPQRTRLLRAELKDGGGLPTLRVLSGQQSHELENSVRANCLLRIEPETADATVTQTVQWMAC